MNQHLFLALACQDARPLVRAYEELPETPQTCQWANFLRNHDELDLGRLTGEQRDAVFERFARFGHAAVRPRHSAQAGAAPGRRSPADRTRV